MDTPENSLVPMPEIVSLNIDDLDVEELERRLELSIGLAVATSCGVNICGINICGVNMGMD